VIAVLGWGCDPPIYGEGEAVGVWDGIVNGIHP